MSDNALSQTAVPQEMNLDRVLDVKVNLALEVGRANLSLRELLDLNQGSIVELDRQAGEPLDVLVNGTLVAHGEVVMVDDKFGVYLTEVIEPEVRSNNVGANAMPTTARNNNATGPESPPASDSSVMGH